MTLFAVSFNLTVHLSMNDFNAENMNYDDSLNCVQVRFLPLQNSNKILCVEQNFFGDTLAIGLREEIVVKTKGLFHIKSKSFRLNSSNTSYGNKVGLWYYYYLNGTLKEKIKH